MRINELKQNLGNTGNDIKKHKKENITYCTNCGKKINKDWKYCKYCGNEIK